MRSKRFRRSNHPLTRVIDAAVDARKTAGSPVSTGEVVSDLLNSVPGPLMITEFGRLVGGRVNARLKARGEIVVDDKTWDRKTDVDVTNVEFGVYVGIKQSHLTHVQDRLKADLAVGKFLARQSAKLGRPVTMGEFEPEIDAIYAKHGF